MKSLIFFVAFVQLTAYSQPWVNNNAKWRYRFQDQGLAGNQGIFETIKSGNVSINGKICDELITKQINYWNNGLIWAPLDTIIIDTNYTYKSISGDTIYWLENNSFQILYDFSKIENEIWITSVSNELDENNCNDSSFVKIMQKDFIDIGGVWYRKLYLNPINYTQKYQLRGEYNERFGPFGCCISDELDSYIFPTKELNCWGNSMNNFKYYFLCFEDDNLTFNLNCDYFTNYIDEKNQNIKIYPNPFQSNITVVGIDLPCEIAITDMNNRVIRTFQSTESFFNTSLSFLENGIYWMTILNDNSSILRLKILKN